MQQLVGPARRAARRAGGARPVRPPVESGPARWQHQHAQHQLHAAAVQCSTPSPRPLSCYVRPAAQTTVPTSPSGGPACSPAGLPLSPPASLPTTVLPSSGLPGRAAAPAASAQLCRLRQSDQVDLHSVSTFSVTWYKIVVTTRAYLRSKHFQDFINNPNPQCKKMKLSKFDLAISLIAQSNSGPAVWPSAT